MSLEMWRVKFIRGICLVMINDVRREVEQSGIPEFCYQESMPNQVDS